MRIRWRNFELPSSVIMEKETKWFNMKKMTII